MLKKISSYKRITQTIVPKTLNFIVHIHLQMKTTLRFNKNPQSILLMLTLLWGSIPLTWGQTVDTTHITLLFAGDVMAHDSQLKASLNATSNTYDFKPTLEHVKELIESYDVAFANLETTLGVKPFTGYPNFSSPPQLAADLQWAGFDVLVTANNHSVDKLGKGIDGTIVHLDSLTIAHTGTFYNKAHRDSTYPLLIEAKGFRLALLNYTYGTNGIAIPATKIVNLIDTSQIRQDIIKAKALLPDAIIAMLHWGDEYQSSPNQAQIDLGKYLTSQGVELVIGSHPHVLQPMEWTNDSLQNHLVVYSLGNFVSGQRTIPRDGAAIVGIELTKDKKGCRITDVHYRLIYVHYPIINGIRQFIVVPVAGVEKDAQWQAPGTAGWGRLHDYAKGAREVMKNNVNVTEKQD